MIALMINNLVDLSEDENGMLKIDISTSLCFMKLGALIFSTYICNHCIFLVN